MLRYLVESRAMPVDRVSAAGYADTHPIAEGDDLYGTAVIAASRIGDRARGGEIGGARPTGGDHPDDPGDLGHGGADRRSGAG